MSETQASTNTTATAEPPIGPRGNAHSAAFKRLEPLIRSVPPEQFVAMNIDLPLTVSIAFAAMPRIVALRPRMATLGVELDMKLIDEMVACGEAFLYANADHVSLSSPLESLPELAEEGTRLREMMLSMYQVLEQRGTVKGAFTEGLKGTVGYRNLSHDLNALAQFYTDSWSVVANKMPLTMDDISRASVLAEVVFSGQVLRQGTPKEIADSALLRQQAFALFARAYDEARRAVTFLRWREDDADDIAPSIYTARGVRRKQEPGTTDTQGVSSVPAVNTATQAPSNVTMQASVPVGHFGSSPFKS